MYPSRFHYEAPRSLDEAFGVLQTYGDEAKILAGGQSLIPLIKLRFASPACIVDINNIPGLEYHEEDSDGSLHIGALCRHRDLERSALLRSKYPVMSVVAPLISDPMVRNRGTLVGSLCHADPQGDWASTMLALGGEVIARNADGGERAIPVSQFVVGPFQNTLQQGEIAVRARVPAPRGPTRRSAGRNHAPNLRPRQRRPGPPIPRSNSSSMSPFASCGSATRCAPTMPPKVLVSS